MLMCHTRIVATLAVPLRRIYRKEVSVGHAAEGAGDKRVTSSEMCKHRRKLKPRPTIRTKGVAAIPHPRLDRL